jgi:hypothetical protein
MNNKKMVRDTVGMVIGGVGISEANKIGGPGGTLLGTAMAGGMAMAMVGGKKKKGGM